VISLVFSQCFNGTGNPKGKYQNNVPSIVLYQSDRLLWWGDNRGEIAHWFVERAASHDSTVV
jgi:hypothetical protein